MKPYLILNPYAGRWRALARQPELESALRAASLPVEIAVSQAPGHASELAERAVLQGYSPILAAGGDGTLSEVFNGMMRAYPADAGAVGPFGILPLGTANDLADQLGIPRSLEQAVQLIKRGKTLTIDVCEVNRRYFLNNAGLGLEPYITILQAKMKRLKGTLRYMVAALQGIWHHPTWNMRVEWDGGQYHGPITLISVGNCARTGGVFYTVPHAEFNDGRLSFIYGYIASRLKTLFALPMTMKPDRGNIAEHPAVHEFHAAWMRVHSETPTPAHADGEIFSYGDQRFDFRILPGKLDVFVP